MQNWLTFDYEEYEWFFDTKIAAANYNIFGPVRAVENNGGHILSGHNGSDLQP